MAVRSPEKQGSKSIGAGKLLVPALAGVSFGLYPAAAKLAYIDGANLTFVLSVTTFSRAFALVLFCLCTGKVLLPKRPQWRSTLSGGFFQALSVFGIIASLLYLPGPVTIILVFTHTIMLLLLLAYKGEIKLTAFAIISTLSALFGVSLVVDVWHNLHNLSWIGICLAMLSAFATVSRLYIFGKQVQDINPAVVGARIFSVAFLFLGSLVLFKAPVGPASAAGYIGLAWCCVSLILGTFCMFYGIAIAGSFQYSLMAKLEPMFTALFSFLLLGEVLNPYQYIGMIVVIGSLIGYQYFDGRTEIKSTSADARS